MVIDLKQISPVAPYEIIPTGQPGFFKFTTDYGVAYRVGFLPSDLLETENTYEFVLANLNNLKSPGDQKLKQTVLALIYGFFQQADSVFLSLFSKTYM